MIAAGTSTWVAFLEGEVDVDRLGLGVDVGVRGDVRVRVLKRDPRGGYQRDV